ncbi:universal stress protein, partial [Nocardia farcinica]|uniref:universal stress protein n=1 Tax=Nocardia farcinica TaxID=37329 RepID=UPI0024558AEE
MAAHPLVVGVDDSAASDLAVRWAAETAAARDRPLRLVHALDLAATRAVFGPYALLVPSVTAEFHQQGVEYLAAAAQLATETAPGCAVDTELVEGSAAEVLIDRSDFAAMTVLGTGNAGALGNLGSTLSAVVAHGHGPITVVRASGNDTSIRRCGPVVVGVGGGAGRPPPPPRPPAPPPARPRAPPRGPGAGGGPAGGGAARGGGGGGGGPPAPPPHPPTTANERHPAPPPPPPQHKHTTPTPPTTP